MSSATPDRGPHHAEETYGEKVILVEFVEDQRPKDSPEFQERAKRAAARPVPPYTREQSKPDENPPAAT